MCHIVVIIIDIVCNIWQQILYHIVVLIFTLRNINASKDLCNL